MTTFPKSIFVSAIALLTSCTSLIDSTQPDKALALVEQACTEIEAEREYPWDILERDEYQTDALWQGFRTKYETAEPDEKGSRDIVIFIDGTGNDDSTGTNVWKLYSLAVTRACNHGVIPFYHQGLGTNAGSLILGSIAGRGIDRHIRESYEALARTYKPKDRVFLFGFSRGAYTARSLNGFIEFAGLLDVNALALENQSEVDDSIADEVAKLYDAYNTLNDGLPNFEPRLRKQIEEATPNFPIYGRNGRPISEKVIVTAIGVYDSVPALGLGRDDNPDDHRVNLYARKGFHALSLDEQRDDFRPIKFDDQINQDGDQIVDGQKLEEVWFAGAHADVGGGYDAECYPNPKAKTCQVKPNEDFGLQKPARDWMLKNFSSYAIFPEKSYGPECGTEGALCERGRLHDAFIDKPLFYRRMGLHWRNPLQNEKIHRSVLCRTQLDAVPYPHSRERKYKPDQKYRPENLIYPLEDNYKIVGGKCSGE